MKKITQFIQETHPHLSKLMTGKDNIGKIKNALETIELFAKHCDDYRVIKFSQGILYLSVSTAAFAMHVRHSATMILQHLQHNAPEITFNAVQCKVSSPVSKATQEPLYRKNKPAIISATTRKKLTLLSEK